jgi:hypothetical protein
VCQKAVEYLKKLGYFYDLSFDSFLSPNTKDTSRILSYLLELIFKTEEGEGKNQKAQAAPTNEYEVLLRRRL